MIVDVHTHTPRYKEEVPADKVKINTVGRPDRAVKTTCTWDEYFSAMEGADRCIVFSIKMKDQESPNQRTAEFVHAYPQKLIGFLSVHPEDDDALQEIEHGMNELGLKGIKLGPNYQNFDPLSDSACAVYERAQVLGLPILFHQGTSPQQFAPLEYAHPLAMDKVAIRFPELRIVMAHMGHPWQEDTIAVIRKHKHVFADISALFYRPWSFYHCMRLATEWNVLSKLLFGTDFPIATVKENIESLRRINEIPSGSGLPQIPEAEIERIIQRDSLALLGLEA
ncbi:MAG: amidohydrolase family protein [Planctomycetota bacterium]|jgi:predicted TIM-barrel fold metal-dependent hydrolase